MHYRQVIATVAVAGLMCSGLVGSTLAAPKDKAGSGGDEKVTLCHRTGSETNPYVEITIGPIAALKHLERHDVTLNWKGSGVKAGTLMVRGDFLSDPVTGCTVPPVPPSGPFVECEVSVGVMQTETTVTGTSADDTIDCTNASPGKTITGGDGNDTITGTAFDDKITGGNGNDTITGGPGDDVIEGGNGNDTLTGSGGNDVVTDVGDGNDTITP